MFSLASFAEVDARGAAAGWLSDWELGSTSSQGPKMDLGGLGGDISEDSMAFFVLEGVRRVER